MALTGSTPGCAAGPLAARKFFDEDFAGLGLETERLDGKNGTNELAQTTTAPCFEASNCRFAEASLSARIALAPPN